MVIFMRLIILVTIGSHISHALTITSSKFHIGMTHIMNVMKDTESTPFEGLPMMG